MSWATRFAARFRGLVLRNRLERELEDEVAFHLEMQTEDNLRAGMDPAEARFAAMRNFGGTDRMKEAYREARSIAAIEILAQDVRYALRTLRINPGFTAVAVLSLMLGIGANTAIFTLIDALLLRQLPVPDPWQLVQLVVPTRTERPFDTFPYPLVHALQDQQEIFSGLAGVGTATLPVGPSEAAEQVPSAWVTGSYYQTLGLRPALGRLLSPDDDRPGAEPAAVISDGYWERRFGRDPAVVGKKISMEKATAVIVGVSPPGFTGVYVGQLADITVTGAALAQILPDVGTYWIKPNYRLLRIIARPRAGLSRQRASDRLASIWPGLVQGSVFQKDLLPAPDLRPAATGWTDLRRQFRLPLLVLMAVVAIVLLIACTNVANLLLARASTRQREIALRMAIGASRTRVACQLLTEGLLLSTCGALLGIGLAWFGSRFLVDLISTGPGARVFLDVAPHGRVLLLTALVALATTIVFGIAPAFGMAGAAPAAALKNSPSRLGGRRSLLAPALIVVQVSLSLLLLIGAGLFLGTLRNLRRLDAGFRHEGVLLVNVNRNKAINRETTLRHFYRDVIESAGRLPGVTSVSLSDSRVFGGGAVRYGVSVAGASSAREDVDLDRIGPRYFETLHTPMLAGREFTAGDDPASSRVAIVNQAFARHFFLRQNPVGRSLSIEGEPGPVQIVGMAKDSRSENLREPAVPVLYVPYFQRSDAFTATLEVYATGSLAQVVAELRREIQTLTSAAPKITPLTAQVERSLVEERLVATLAASFGVLALTLAGIGLYGLLAYSVARRTREIGIRMALGAAPKHVLQNVIVHALGLLALGICLGVPAACVATRWVSSLLFGLTPTDPATIVVAIAVLAGVGLLAGLLPALRASHVDPALALRSE